jgi:hypothetical protein
MGATVQANDGTMIPLDSTPQEFMYDGDFISTITVQYAGKTFVQTFENDGTNIIYISNWVYTPIPPGGEIMVTEGANGEVMTEEDGTTIMVTES